MIDPKSLRIWNTVNFGGRPISLTAEDMVYLLTMQAKIQATNNYQPIPLSEQELIRLGWQSIGELHPTFKLWNYLLEEDMLRTGKYYLRQIINKEDSLVIAGDLLYVHELQNIFHDLKRKELEYKVDSGLTPTEPDTKEPKQ